MQLIFGAGFYSGTLRVLDISTKKLNFHTHICSFRKRLEKFCPRNQAIFHYQVNLEK
jgi:hypothetical protein